MNRELVEKIQKLVLEQDVKDLEKLVSKAAQENINSYLPLYLKSKEFKKTCRNALIESIKEFLFDDLDWIPWKKIQDKTLKMLMAGKLK